MNDLLIDLERLFTQMRDAANRLITLLPGIPLVDAWQSEVDAATTNAAKAARRLERAVYQIQIEIANQAIAAEQAEKSALQTTLGTKPPL